MKGVGGYSGWRWIFIIEGLVTVVTTVLGLFCIPDYPEKSTFLKLDEKKYLLDMLKVIIYHALSRTVVHNLPYLD